MKVFLLIFPQNLFEIGVFHYQEFEIGVFHDLGSSSMLYKA